MLSAVVDLLCCPVCRAPLELADRTLWCGQGHNFDLARQGYVTLLGGAGNSFHSDTTEMLAARTRFLDGGFFDPILRAVGAECADGATVLDVGAGTGHYLAAAVRRGGGRGVGVDLSKLAARQISRLEGPIGAIVADAWQPLPIADGVIDVALSVFSPRNVAEFARVLAPGGRLVVVSPTPRHLTEIVAAVGMIGVDKDKSVRIGNSMAGHFTRTARSLLEYPITLSHNQVVDVVLMGPSAFHLTEQDVTSRLTGHADPMTVTVSVTAAVYQPDSVTDS
ncbi:putative RNA methyltransferase [Gordonia rubripertincta]|uniref:Methyltransferase domain-containing protein n=1 Tax=Gordonia rubripertincta TaxID=36822 RepID=A0ABT4MP00_GORRU|nr:methyltransferase domain-containing protein [Gordonia rubripertincta]MCZ4548723.1 methyltransferase domain-containing protein [Gordonia rubripertincta]